MANDILRLIMPALKPENRNEGGDIGIILPLVLLLAVDSGDMPLILCLLYIVMK